MKQRSHILITGSPGVGKTTLLRKIEHFLRKNRVQVGGLFSPEIKIEGKREGFALVDILTGEKGILASKNASGPMVGRYAVNINDIDKIGVRAIEQALKSSEYILIDEIGPMEIKSQKFIKTVQKALSSSRIVIAVIHKRSKDQFIQKIKNREDVILWDIHTDNRDLIYDEIIKTLKSQDHYLA